MERAYEEKVNIEMLKRREIFMGTNPWRSVLALNP